MPFWKARLPMQVGIVLAVLALYGPHLEIPLLFDDFGIVDTDDPKYWDWTRALTYRWYSYASFHWSTAWFGSDLRVLHAGNVALHIATSLVLFQFLARLFEVACHGEPDAGGHRGLSSLSLAFVGALAFALHPVATFGVAYLVQRTILSATLFAVLCGWLFLEGVVRQRQGWLWASAIAYLLSVLGKEHAILLPLANLCLLLALGFKANGATLRLLWRPAIAYASVFLFTLYQARADRKLGAAYEPHANTLFETLGLVPGTEHVLSIVTQARAFFDYLWHWLVPRPSRMSIALEAEFATRLTDWTQAISPVLFLGALLAALWLARRGGRLGLVGFAFAVPALLFPVEFVPIRIQETFVLYRSYLWMPALACVLPYLLQKVDRKMAWLVLLPMLMFLYGASTQRLDVLGDPIKIWDEAYRLGQHTKQDWNRARIHHNRGVAYLDRGRYQDALADFNDAIRLALYLHNAYHDRAVVHLEQGDYDAALADFSQSILIRPDNAFHYYGRAHVYLALGLPQRARQDLSRSCELGRPQACARLGEL